MSVYEKESDLDRLVSVGGVVLSDNTDSKTAPQSSGNSNEHVPVLDHALGIIVEDACELLRQGIEGEEECHLHIHTASFNCLSTANAQHCIKIITTMGSSEGQVYCE